MKIWSISGRRPQALRNALRYYAVAPKEPSLALEYVVQTDAPTIMRMSCDGREYHVQLGDVRASIHIRVTCDLDGDAVWMETEVVANSKKNTFRHDPVPNAHLLRFKGNPCFEVIKWLIREYPEQGVNHK